MGDTMKSTTVARIIVFVALAAVFVWLGWQLLLSAPTSKRERPAAPTPLVDVIDSTPNTYPLTLEAAGTVRSALELEVRPQVGGRIVDMHPDFEPGGHIAAGSPILQIERADYELAVDAAQAEIAKARATMALEKGRRVVAREELATLGGSLKFDAESEALALRQPQLKQVQAELEAAQNRLEQAKLDLQRTSLTLPYDVIVIERVRVPGEVVAARELVGRVARADEYWIELRSLPAKIGYLKARTDRAPGSVAHIQTARSEVTGEIIRIRADLAADSRLAGAIASVPVDASIREHLLLGSYVEATVDAGEMPQVIKVPRRALRDNNQLWVVDTQGRLQVREARVQWEAGQHFLLDRSSIEPGDHIIVSRVSGLITGSDVRQRRVDVDTGELLDDATDEGTRND